MKTSRITLDLNRETELNPPLLLGFESNAEGYVG